MRKREGRTKGEGGRYLKIEKKGREGENDSEGERWRGKEDGREGGGGKGRRGKEGE